MELWDLKLINRCMVITMIAWCFQRSACKRACDLCTHNPLHAALAYLRCTSCTLPQAVLTCIYIPFCAATACPSHLPLHACRA